MTIRKLTVAAAIAVGIATCSFSTAEAACPCNQTPVVTQSPCGCEELPVVTGNACPCDTAVPDTTCGCDAAPQCEPDPVPSCSLCPSAKHLSRADMRQVYSYPNAIYGTNNFVGTEKDSIYTSEGFSVNRTYNGLTAQTMGSKVASDGSITGAASNIPCLNDIAPHLGSPIIREESRMDGMGCPIQMGTANSIKAVKKSLVPFDLTPFNNLSGMNTGAAANMMQMFPDVPSSHWAACEIDKLATNDVIVGYPDRMYKPYRNITRAEFATMLVKGFNKDVYGNEKLFSDVPLNHWASSAITVAVHNDLLKGYPNGKFMPNNNVTRVEALCAMSKAIQCGEMSKCDAQAVLAKYTDGAQVPEWAQIPIAKALDKGALSNSPNPNRINPFAEATRADIAAMLQNIRVATGLDTNPVTANNDCPICPVDKKAFLQEEEIVKIPTLKLKFRDQVSAKSSHVGQRFAAKTMEDVTINGQLYPVGSNVYGKVVEVVRPSGCQKGALKLAFQEIENCGHRATLPQQILNADISKSRTPNVISRIVTAPLTWSGQILGIVGRTAGGAVSNLGNALEDVASGTGIALGEAFQGQFMASARSVGDVLYDTVKAPVDIVRTGVSGTVGLVQATGDEIGYLVDPRGSKISSINPREHVTIAFGCNGK